MDQQRQDATTGEINRLWRSLFSALNSAKTGTADDCFTLSKLPTHEARINFMRQVWGGVAVDKNIHFLSRIEALESALPQNQDDKTPGDNAQ